MTDFRLALAQEVAAQIGAEVLPQRCIAVISDGVVCDHPLMMKPEQGLPFCWFCVTDRMAAQRGRTALTKAKMASKGIFIEVDMHACPQMVERQEQEERSSWIDGMPI